MSLLDLLFPPRCGGCRRYGAAWCDRCAAAIEPIEPAALGGVPLIAGGRLTGPLQRAIHTYKYGGRARLASELVRPLVAAVRTAALPIAALTFVPLHPQRLRERGFDQAQRLADELARVIGLPRLDGLERVRPTPAQVGLGQAERRHNLLDAFAWRGDKPLQGLALVDDVCTTGATLLAAAQAVGQAGGSIGAFLVLARAQTLPAPAVTVQGQSACP